ncbi:25548_t:CDS:2, partial [Racocetra persica]
TTEGLPHIVQLYTNANRAARHASKGNQLEILAKSMIYKEIMSHLSYVTQETLRKRTQRANIIYNLFSAIGVDKISRIKSFSANTLSNLKTQDIELIKLH